MSVLRRLLAGRLPRPSAILRRLEDAVAGASPDRIARLRALGVKIGERCSILSDSFSTEPYLVTIGDHVGSSSAVELVTHHGAAWLLRERHPLGAIVAHPHRLDLRDTPEPERRARLLAHFGLDARWNDRAHD